jgi:hypothetical protein
VADPVQNAQPSAHHGGTGSWEPPKDDLPFTDKVHLAQADNFEEKELYFQNKYGKGNVKRDWGSGGKADLVVTAPNGHVYRVGETEDGAGFVAKLTGDSPMLAGMGIGAASGAAYGSGLGPLGAAAGGVLGAGIGAMVGKGGTEIGKAVEGNLKKSPKQVMEGLGGAAEEGMTGEVTGQIAGKVVGKALTARLPSFITGATDESRAQTSKAWEAGARPPYASMAPGAVKLRRIEVDAEKLTGKYVAQDERNMAYVQATVREQLAKSGMPKAYIDQVMAELSDPTAAASHEAIGQELKAGVEAHVQALHTNVQRVAEVADKQIDAQLATVRAELDKNSTGPLATAVADSIKSAKQTFSESARGLYGRIDAMLGNTKVVPVEPIVEAANEIRSQLPKSVLTQIVKEASQLAGKPLSESDALLLNEFGVELDAGGKISLSDAQRIRTVLRDKGGASKLTRGIVEGDHLKLANAVDQAINEAAADPVAKPAIDMLRTTNEWYKKGIAKFNDVAFKQLVNATKSGMPPDPYKIVNILTQPGQSARIGTLRSLVSPETWKQVQAVHLRRYLDGFTSIGENGKPTLDGMKLLDKMGDKDTFESFEKVHDKETVAQLREIAEMTAARRGKLSPDAIKNGDVKTALQSMKDHEARLDDFMKKNALAILADPSKSGEEAYQWVVRPGAEGEARTMAVAKTFGINSPQMKGVQQAALEELARNANIAAINKSGNRAIDDALSAFTKNQQKILFPGSTADDMRQVSKVIQFMFPFKSGMQADTGMAGMHAGSVLEKPLKVRLYKQAVAAVTRFVALHPAVAKFIVTGREEGSEAWMVHTADLFNRMAQVPAAESVSPNTNQGAPIQPPAPATVQ